MILYDGTEGIYVYPCTQGYPDMSRPGVVYDGTLVCLASGKACALERCQDTAVVSVLDGARVCVLCCHLTSTSMPCGFCRRAVCTECRMMVSEVDAVCSACVVHARNRGHLLAVMSAYATECGAEGEMICDGVAIRVGRRTVILRQTVRGAGMFGPDGRLAYQPAGAYGFVLFGDLVADEQTGASTPCVVKVAIASDDDAESTVWYEAQVMIALGLHDLGDAYDRRAPIPLENVQTTRLQAVGVVAAAGTMAWLDQQFAMVLTPRYERTFYNDGPRIERDFAAQLFLALTAERELVHRLCVTHGDMHGDNIAYAHDGSVVLADWGLVHPVGWSNPRMKQYHYERYGRVWLPRRRMLLQRFGRALWPERNPHDYACAPVPVQTLYQILTSCAFPEATPLMQAIGVDLWPVVKMANSRDGIDLPALEVAYIQCLAAATTTLQKWLSHEVLALEAAAPSRRAPSDSEQPPSKRVRPDAEVVHVHGNTRITRRVCDDGAGKARVEWRVERSHAVRSNVM
jgi:hypothetical protein